MFVKDKEFYKTVARLVIPITLQNVMSLLLNMMDTVMLGQMSDRSEEAISAANLANQPFFVFTLFLFGMISGATVLISQYWGKNDRKSINAVCGIAMTAALTIGVIFTAVCIIFTLPVMGLFTDSPSVIRIGASYLRIVAISYIPAAITSLLCGIMKAVEHVKIILFTNSMAIVINIILNYILIFGKFGAPAFGVQGAAIATLISRLIELTMVLIFVFGIEKQLRLRIGDMMKITKPLVQDFIRYSSPVIFNETVWGLGITFHAAIIGHLGEEAYAAYTITNVIERVGQLAAMGFANAAAIIIGKELGAGHNSKVYGYAKTLMIMSTGLGLITSAVVWIIHMPVSQFFNVADSTRAMTHSIIFFYIFFNVCKYFNCLNIVGILRGGGDTVAAMLCDFLPMWFYCIPLGFIAAFYFKLPVQYVYAVLVCDEALKIPFGFARFKSKKWIKNITR
ncbi:MAG: MATE family efflux transporter [Clostridia bacterium]|nr:MATE family efflux transporter [Clostridia bacterium]